ncbi:MAG: amidohydrolase family protein [Opitutaceae bacterium]
MEILDAQIHKPHPERDLGPDVTYEQADIVSIEVAIAAMDAVGVHGAVVNADEIDFCELAVRLYPSRLMGVPRIVEPRSPDADRTMRRVKENRGLLSVRVTPGYPFDGSSMVPFREGAYDPLFAAAEKDGIPICVFIPGHLPDLRPVIQAHPDLVLIIDHIGMMPPPLVPVTTNTFDTLPDLLELARFPNVAVKFSGVPALSTGRYPFDDLWPKVGQIIDAFGAERLMWGSDYTRCKRLHSYAEAVGFLRYTDRLSESDKRMIFSGSLRRWMRWPSQSGARTS